MHVIGHVEGSHGSGHQGREELEERIEKCRIAKRQDAGCNPGGAVAMPIDFRSTAGRWLSGRVVP